VPFEWPLDRRRITEIDEMLNRDGHIMLWSDRGGYNEFDRVDPRQKARKLGVTQLNMIVVKLRPDQHEENIEIVDRKFVSGRPVFIDFSILVRQTDCIPGS
jgi:hypothetical protein